MKRMIEDMNKVQFLNTEKVKNVFENKKCLVIHHDDNDGCFGAYIMEHRDELGLTHSEQDVLLASNYNSIFGYEMYKDAIAAGCKVAVIVDYNIPFEELQTMLHHFEYIVYTDHHRTTYNMYTKHREALKEMFTNDQLSFVYASQCSGCTIIQNLVEELAQRKFDAGTHYLDKMIDTYDRNADPGYPEAWYLSDYLFKNFRNTPDSDIWTKLRNKEFMINALTVGRQINSLNYVMNEISFSNFTKKVEWEGKTWHVLYGYGNSYCFNKHIDEVDGVIIYHPLPKSNKLKYSMFSSKMDNDVCAIAEKYGGGGHKSAAGFTAEEDFFK